MLSNMRLCSNVPAQSIVQTSLGGYQSVKNYIKPGGRVYEQCEYIYKALNDIPGISAVKPKAGFYIFPKLDVKKFNITDDEKFTFGAGVSGQYARNNAKDISLTTTATDGQNTKSLTQEFKLHKEGFVLSPELKATWHANKNISVGANVNLFGGGITAQIAF